MGLRQTLHFHGKGLNLKKMKSAVANPIEKKSGLKTVPAKASREKKIRYADREQLKASAERIFDQYEEVFRRLAQ